MSDIIESKNVVPIIIIPKVYCCYIISGKYNHIELLPFEKKVTETDISFIDEIDFKKNYNHMIINEIENILIPLVMTEDIDINNDKKLCAYLIDLLINRGDYTLKDIYFGIINYLFIKKLENNIDNNIIIFIKELISTFSDLIKYYPRFTVTTNRILSERGFIFNKIISQHIELDSDEIDIINNIVIEKDNLDKIPIVKYNDMMINNDIRTKNQECHICIEYFKDNDDIRLINCNHLFHKNCIDMWLSKSSYKCPLCREPVYKESTKV
jgi:hypothetical protein